MKKHLSLFITLLVFTTSFCNAQSPLLWGLSVMGGNNTEGNIFSYQAGTLFGNDYGFGTGGEGYAPWGSLVKANNGLLYGMTKQGGAHGIGDIFSYDPLTGIEKDIHDFAGSGADDGAAPNGYFIQATNGLLYAMVDGGGANNAGVIISLNPANDSEKVIYSFAGAPTDGSYPFGSLMQAGNGLLYGLTWRGGAADSGTVFSFDITTGVETKLHDFGTGSDGAYPYGVFVQAKDSLLYGLTSAGGTGGNGILFSYDIHTNKDSILHNFAGYPTDGGYPYGSLIHGGDENLYGLTEGGGTKGSGTIFKYNITAGAETILYDFYSVAMDGERPYGSLLQASDGVLYGYTSAGGTYNDGILFSFNITDSTYTNVFNFTGIDAWQPYYGALIEDDTSSQPNSVSKLENGNQKLGVYPNPASDNVNIILSKPCEHCTLDITDVTGREIMQGVLSGINSTIDMTGMAAGFYFIRVGTAQETYTSKVVKQ